jgi:DNA-binding MarR family transcriptional regulator/GNAT superfamily N-acetyltransferase
VDCVHYLPAMTVVDRFRRFSRTWTEIIGLLGSGLLQTDHSLTEARVLFELAQQERWERSDLRSRLDIDASFLTRVLGRLEDKGLVTSSQSPDDGRALIVELTAAGRGAFAELDRRSVEQVTDLVSPLTEEQKTSLVESMGVITHLLRPDDSSGEVVIRGIRPGDLGWVVSRHGAIYAQEYGWDISFEGLVAKIVADYQANFRPGRENAWIAELDGARAGCVFCVERDLATAQLRILIVEPWARGHGIGRRLVDECVSFARSAGYEKMMLWTNDVLVSARRIYEAVGFRLVEEEQHHSFGHDLVGQNWELDL